MKRKYLFIMLLLSIMYVATSKNLMANANELIYKEVDAIPGDTSLEIQKLLDNNKDGKYNLVVNIPEGEYILNKELRIFSNTSIRADKNALLLKNHQRGAMLANDLSKDTGGYNTTKNITISGGIWDSSPIASLNKGTESLRFIHATDVTVKGATVRNVPDGSHLITFAGVKNGIIKNCSLYGYGGRMLKEAIQLDIVHDKVIVPSMQEKHLVYDDLACDNILVTGCEIYDYSRAIGSHTSIKGVFHKNITIHNNQLHDLQDTALKAYNYINLTVSSNTIYNVNMGILAYTYIKNEDKHYLEALDTTIKEPHPDDYNIIIKNNTLYDIAETISTEVAAWGDAIHTIGSSSRPLTGVDIYNNRIKNVQRCGIFLEGTTGSKITNNSIYKTNNSGIYLIAGSHSAKITYNTLNKTGVLKESTGGLSLNNSNKASILYNNLSYSGKNGISLYNQSNNVKINNNAIVNTGENAIALYNQSNKAIVSSNIIKNYGLNGIFAYETKSANIKTNKIYGKKTDKSKDGIHIIGDNTKKTDFIIYRNYATNTNRNAIYVTKAPKTYISKNVLVNFLKTAIFLGEGSSNSKLKSNKIHT